MPISLRFFLVFAMCAIKDSTQIQNVRLIVPTVVQAGTSATLFCLYDLQGASLYSVQWYRGKFEFFRFVPNEIPSTKVFHIPGLHVDMFGSNDHQVTLTNIPVQFSGEFSCEITTDAPPFSTSCVSENLTIIDFNLILEVPKKQYYFGDIIDANCTLMPKLPSTRLIFHWNAKLISEKFVMNGLLKSTRIRFNSNTDDVGHEFPVLVPLKCTAIIHDMQHTISRTIFLKLKQNPAAKTSESSNSFLSFLVFIFTLVLQSEGSGG